MSSLTPSTELARPRRFAALALVAALVLAGCGGGDDDSESGNSESPGTDTSSTSPSGQESSSVPEDDGITDPGSSLGLGDAATFEWKPTAKLSSEAEVRVTRIDKASVKAFAGFKLTDEMKKSTPYFVHLKVKNTGGKNLGNLELPVFLDNGSSVLYPAAHISGFAPCQPRVLPEKFKKGKQASLCLVFLAPPKSKLRSIALRPDEELDQIDWTGKVTKPGAKTGKGKKGKKKS